MNDVELVRRLVDGLDTGLPERPDLTAVRAAGIRQRRRRLGWTTGACVAAGAIVVPAIMLAGPGGTAPTVVPDPVADPGRAAAPAPPPVSPDELAGPEFGVGMRAAVEQALPGVTFQSERLGDHWRFSQHFDAYMETTADPIRWDTLFQWTQGYALPGGGHLDVIASRTSSNAYIGGTGPTKCDEAVFPSRVSCEATDVGAQRVVVNDGVQYDDTGRWARQVDVSYLDQTRGMDAHVELTVFTDAPTWAQARGALPSSADLTSLGLQAALVLPAPDHYPVPDDVEEHMTTP